MGYNILGTKEEELEMEEEDFSIYNIIKQARKKKIRDEYGL